MNRTLPGGLVSLVLLAAGVQTSFAFSEGTDGRAGKLSGGLTAAGDVSSSLAARTPARLASPLPTEQRNESVFDYSTSLAPRAKPATASPQAAPVSIDDEIARHQTVSVSRDGKVETTQLPEQIKQRVIETIQKINREKKSNPASAAPSQGPALVSTDNMPTRQLA